MTELRITPIGTCRIHTPLKRGSLRYPISIELGRNYGFVHTAAEVLQQIRFLRGEQDIPAEVAPLVISNGDLSEYAAQSWSPSDLHIVEISSAKKLMCGEHAVQINYIYRHFADFFANRERSRAFWNLLRAGHHGDLVAYLAQEPTFRLLSRDDRELLRSLKYEQQSFRGIKSEMAEIVDRLGADKLMFVTHVNAKTPDDEIIASRDRLIRWVKLAGEQLGVKVFDPSGAMEEVGQELALDNAGLDLTHYTPAFSDRVYEELHRFHIGELMGSTLGDSEGPSEDRTQAAAANFETMLQVGDFLETAKQIHGAIARSPGSAPLIELRGVVRARIGDYPAAIADLTCRGDPEALSQPMRIALLNALTAVGDFEGALGVASDLISDEYETPELFGSASEAAEHVGKYQLAIQYAKQSFRLDRSDLAAALRALRLLSLHSSEEMVAQWREELLENLGTSSNGAFDLCQWAIENRDEELFAVAIPAVADRSATVDLVDEAFRAGLYGAVADSVSTLVGLGRLIPTLAKSRAALIEEILEKSEELFENGKAASAYRCAKALAALTDVPAGQLRTARLAALAERQITHWTRAVRTQIREAEEKSPDSVIEVAKRSGDLIKTDPAIAVAVARALADKDRSADALSLIRSVDPAVADDRFFRRWAGRIAAHAEDFGLALEMYGSLSDDQDASAKLRSEADRLLASLRSRSITQLRALIAAEKFEEALALAGAITRRTGEVERVQRELARMYNRLRYLAIDIQKGDGDEELERVLRLIAKIRPDDQSMLRRLALELMRQFRFAEAAEVWSRIHLLAPNNETAVRALNRCETLARRRSGVELHSAA